MHYPKNPYIKNGKLAGLYLSFLRKNWRLSAKLMGTVLGCEIACPVPRRLFLPHPTGIVVDADCVLGENVVLLQQVTLGVQHPYGQIRDEPRDPVIETGVYVGPGAKILGPVSIGEWSVIGANAVVTCNVPPHSIIVGYNKILDKDTIELEQQILNATNR